MNGKGAIAFFTTTYQRILFIKKSELIEYTSGGTKIERNDLTR